MKKFVAFGSLFIILFVTSVVLTSCGGDEQKSADFSKSKSVNSDMTGGLSEFELENGIGPVKQKLELGQIDPKLVKKGEEIFNTKCVACHKLDERYVGPAQRDVIKRRTPEFIMNMMLNPQEMQEKHPVVKKLLAEYMTQMTNQNLSFDDARALLEYFREVGK
ncbi:MAG: cytochrome c [Ignavibacterium album]|uniref:c-type cytochrome n=1 Tax=Ignavibacterium album TaxID=591197 RepID=UPI0026EC40F6|nr:cytochrome c [Ignavibacterium album]MCX8106422.1 cytochrome c [Ignavibacterium album]